MTDGPNYNTTYTEQSGKWYMYLEIGHSLWRHRNQSGVIWQETKNNFETQLELSLNAI